MKAKKLVTLLMVVCVLTATISLTACGNDSNVHNHVFNEVVDEQYLKSAANCTSKAVYYKSCECGETSKDTFMYGNVDKTKHNFVDNACSLCGASLLSYTLNSDGKSYSCTRIKFFVRGTLIIPSTHNGLPVTSIGSWVFGPESSKDITSIIIPDSITSIEERAFIGCSKLVEVINKSSLNITKGSWDNGYVGYNALTVHNGESKIVNKDGYLFITGDDGVNYLFDYTGSETELVLPSNYNGQNYKINRYAFSGYDLLTSIIIPDTVTSIGERAFRDCDLLTSITIPDNITSIREDAFA